MKKLVIAAMVAAFVMSSSMVMAADKVTCTVDSVDGDKVTMTCKNADKVKAGDAVEVKAKKALEGC
jgi:hypothetical protein